MKNLIIALAVTALFTVSSTEAKGEGLKYKLTHLGIAHKLHRIVKAPFYITGAILAMLGSGVIEGVQDYAYNSEWEW